MEMTLNKIVELLSDHYVIFGVTVVILVLLWLFRQTEVVINIVCNAIIETEEKFNSEEGQAKLDHAVEMVQSKLPFFPRVVLTKYAIVSLIEYFLNTIGKAFKINKVVDIKGNE